VDNAEAVTLTGQTVIKSTADMANIKYNKELGTKGGDYNIYIDTDSVFFSSVPLLNHRYPNWRNETDEEIALKVDAIAGESQNFLNNFYDMLASKAFNIDTHRLQIKKEFVSKAGFWVAKKRYAQWIIMNNGIPMDRLDVKGLDVKRSSFPKAFQDIMAEVLISILRGETEQQISDKVLAFKKKMTEYEVKDVAKNSAVKELTKYMGKKRAPFQVEKGTPAHVKAAIAYNDCLKHFDCPYKYTPMGNGDKVKWVYLKENPLGLEGLAFTGYQDPPEIEKFVKTYVDHNKIFERELKGKLQDFFTAVGWGDVVSEQRTAEKFFSF